MTDRTRSRVLVTHPRTVAVRRTRRASQLAAHIGVDSPVGDVVLRSLMRAQLGLSLRYLLALALLLGGTPLVLVWVPALSTTMVRGIPVAWLLLGAAMFPVLLFIAVRYVQQVERLERRFAHMFNAPQP